MSTYTVTVSGTTFTVSMSSLTYAVTMSQVGPQGATGTVTANTGATINGDLNITDKIVHVGDTNTAIRFPANDTVTVETAGAERLRVNSAGNVGIGTSAPSAKLEVIDGDINAVSVKTDGAIQLYDDATLTRAFTFLSRNISSSMVGGNIRLDTSVTTGSHIGYSKGTLFRGGSGIIFENTSASSFYGDTIFVQTNDTDDDSWAVRETMRIDSSGNVGIGTSSPTGDLTIGTASPRIDFLEAGGSAGFDNTILIRDADVFSIQTRNGGAFVSNDYRITTNAAGALTHEWRTGNTERLRINSAGNVGIGTSSPSERLTTAGNMSLEGSGTGAARRLEDRVIKRSDDGSVNGMAEIALNGAGTNGHLGEIIFRTGASDLFNSALTERLRIDSSGNVGVGESAPDYKLDVNGTFGFTPGASVTPVDNGDVVFELTNNTTLTIKAKGSDGVVRSGTVTLA